MVALSQSNDPILTEQAFTEKELKQNKHSIDKTRNNFYYKLIKICQKKDRLNFKELY